MAPARPVAEPAGAWSSWGDSNSRSLIPDEVARPLAYNSWCFTWRPGTADHVGAMPGRQFCYCDCCPIVNCPDRHP